MKRALNLCNVYGPDPTKADLIRPDTYFGLDRPHYPPSIQVWLEAVPSLTFPYWDMHFVLARVAGEIGPRPDWWEVGEPGGYVDVDDGLGIYFGTNLKGVDWLLRHHIAPRQPFKVGVAMPHGWTSGYYEPEYDEENYAELLAVAPLDPAEAQRRWLWFFDHRERAVAAHRARMNAEHQRAVTDVPALRLRKDWYFHGDPQLGQVGGYIASLYSQHGNRLVAEGRHDVDRGNRKETPQYKVAFERMIESLRKNAPAIDPEHVRKLVPQW